MRQNVIDQKTHAIVHTVYNS